MEIAVVPERASSKEVAWSFSFVVTWAVNEASFTSSSLRLRKSPFPCSVLWKAYDHHEDRTRHRGSECLLLAASDGRAAGVVRNNSMAGRYKVWRLET